MSHAQETEHAFGPWAEGRTRVRALVIVNEKAGGVGAGARDELLAKLDALGGEAVEVRADLDALSAEDATRADVVIVLGGDGTARTAAETLGEGPPLVLLPGGTLNVLPHALYGARAWPEALEAALTQGRVVRLVGGEANGQRFFVAAMFGAPTLLARAREAARAGRFVVFWRRFSLAFRRAFARRLAVRPDGGAASRAEAAGVLCPAYVGEVEGRTLEWVRLDVTHILDFIRVGLRSVIGGWRDDATIDISHCRAGEIRSLGAIPAVLDGEPTSFFSRVRVRILERGPKVLAVD